MVGVREVMVADNAEGMASKAQGIMVVHKAAGSEAVVPQVVGEFHVSAHTRK